MSQLIDLFKKNWDSYLGKYSPLFADDKILLIKNIHRWWEECENKRNRRSEIILRRLAKCIFRRFLRRLFDHFSSNLEEHFTEDELRRLFDTHCFWTKSADVIGSQGAVAKSICCILSENRSIFSVSNVQKWWRMHRIRDVLTCVSRRWHFHWRDSSPGV